MDNSPVHDEAVFDPRARTLNSADVGLNSLIALDAEMLARIAERIGEAEAARRHASTAEGLKARIAERLWDDERQCFANRLWSGKFVRSIAPTSFFPLLAGAASDEQARAMVRLLDDPAKFIEITRGLVQRGYSDAAIEKILGDNFLRVFREVCG